MDPTSQALMGMVFMCCSWVGKAFIVQHSPQLLIKKEPTPVCFPFPRPATARTQATVLQWCRDPIYRRQCLESRTRSNRDLSLRAVDTDELERKSEPDERIVATAEGGTIRPSTEAERLQIQAQMLRLQAEKLRSEAEKEQIKIERENIVRKQKRQQDVTRVTEKLREANGDETQLKHIVQNNLRILDADCIVRIRELGSDASPEQAVAYKDLADSVVRLMGDVDGRRAKEVREELAFRVKDSGKSMAPRKPNSPFDQFSAVQDIIRNQSMASIDQLTQEIMRNDSRGFATIYAINLPQWLPREFMRTLESFEPLQDEDIRTLRTDVFKMDNFFVTDVDKNPLAVAYKGTLRKQSDDVFRDVDRRLQAIEGLRDRVQLFMFENPRPQLQSMGFGGGDETPEIMFMAVSTRVKPLPVGGGQITLSLLSLGATALNALVFSILTFYTPQDIINRLAEEPLARLPDAWPIALAVVAIQLLHDLGHYLAAKSKNIKLGVPIYIPSLQIGTFGSVLRFASFPRSRQDMFDVSLAGPLLGFAVSAAAFAIGMALTQGAPSEVSAAWPMLPVALFRSSLLLWQVGQALFSPDVVNLTLTSSVHVHPLAVAGALGLLAQALQSMPIGRLDGGRATTAVFGRKASTFLSAAIVLYQVISGILLGNTLQLFWGTVVIVFQNAQEMYSRDEMTPVDSNRRNLLLLLWVLTLATLLPGVPWKDVGTFEDARYKTSQSQAALLRLCARNRLEGEGHKEKLKANCWKKSGVYQVPVLCSAKQEAQPHSAEME